MKNLSVQFVCLILGFFVTVFSGCAPSTRLLFEDGFENAAVGAYPRGSGWRKLFGGKTAYVCDDVKHSGRKAFRLESRPTWARSDYIFLGELPDRLSYQVSVLPDLVRGRKGRVGFTEAFRNMGACYNYMGFHNRDGSVGIVYFSSGGSKALRAKNHPHRVELCEFKVGSWITLRADLDFTSSTAELWVDGKLIASDVAIVPRECEDPAYGRVVLNKWGPMPHNFRGATGVLCIDDVRIWERR
jgi:hypothetical protein